jgi:hypothetical protein
MLSFIASVSLNTLNLVSNEFRDYENYKLLRISPKNTDENEFLIQKRKQFNVSFASISNIFLRKKEEKA